MAAPTPIARRVLPLAPLLLAALASIVLLVALTGREGWGVAGPLAVPVLVAALPPALRRTRWRRVALVAASVLLVLFVVLGAASIGLFYLPAAAAMVVVAVVERPVRERARASG